MSNRALRKFADDLQQLCIDIKLDAVESLLHNEPALPYDTYRGRHSAAQDILIRLEQLYKDAVKAQAGEL